jgi:exonuclease VII large subunit
MRQSGQSAGQRSAATQAQNEQMEQAANALKRAQEEMRNAVSQHDAGAQQRAASDLQAAENLLRSMQQQQTGDSLSNLAAQAQQMVQQQKDFANRLREAAKNGEGGDNSGSQMAQRRFGYGGRWNRDPYDPTRRAMPSSTSQQTNRLADEKEKMAGQLEQLQRDLQRQAQSLSGTQPDVSSKLRDALSGVEQQDLAAHMKKNADWIRQGYGSEAWVNEQSATLSLDQFNKRVQDARAAAENAQRGGGPASRATRPRKRCNNFKS